MNFWKSYGAHLLGYVAAAVGITEALTPAALAAYPQLAPLAPYIGPSGLVALVATAAGLGVHQAVTAPPAAPASPPAASGAVVKALPLLFVLGLASAALGLGGCASLNAKMQTPTGQAVIAAAADVAVATAEQHNVTAAQINSIAHQALAADQGASASLAAIAGVVNGQLNKLNLPAGDLAAVQVLEAALQVAILEQVGANPTVAQVQAAAADVINAVIAASGG